MSNSFLLTVKRSHFNHLTEKNIAVCCCPAVKFGKTVHGRLLLQCKNYKAIFFNISHRLLEIFSKIKFSINETAGLRLEALLSGEMRIPVNGERIKFRSGEYRLTDVPLFTALFKQNTSCSIFITHYSLELLKQLKINIEPFAPRRM